MNTETYNNCLPQRYTGATVAQMLWSNQSTFIVFKSKMEHRHDIAKAVKNLRQYRS